MRRRVKFMRSAWVWTHWALSKTKPIIQTWMITNKWHKMIQLMLNNGHVQAVAARIFNVCSLLNFLSIVRRRKSKIVPNLINFLFLCFAFRCSRCFRQGYLPFFRTICSVYFVVALVWTDSRGFIMYVHGAVNKVLYFEDICKLNHPIR